MVPFLGVFRLLVGTSGRPLVPKSELHSSLEIEQLQQRVANEYGGKCLLSSHSEDLPAEEAKSNRNSHSRASLSNRLLPS